MKFQLCILFASVGFIGTAQAQIFDSHPMPNPGASYVGAIIGLTQVKGGCAISPSLNAESLTNFPNTSTSSAANGGTTTVTTFTANTACDNEGKSAKFFAGTHLTDRWFIEASLINFGRQEITTAVTSTRVVTATSPANVTTTVTAPGDSSLIASAQAVGLSMAYRHALNSRLLLSSRIGVALVQTKLKKNLNSNGVSLKYVEQSETKLRPMIGFGAEFRVYDNVSAVLSSDFSTIKAGGETVRLNTYGLGIGMSFDN